MILQHSSYKKSNTYRADVVVVGTGAGGSVAAAELASAGFSVIMVEEGGHHKTQSLNPFFTESLPRLYRDCGTTLIYGQPPITYVEGRCVGGSTVINGGMMYRPPERILESWERLTKAPELGVKGLEEHLQEAERYVNSEHQPPFSVGEDNQLMFEGARRKNWKYSINKRSQSHCVGCGNCVLGCPTGAKQSMLLTRFPAAIQHGAQCLTDVRIEKLIIKKGRCVGISGRAINPVTRKKDRKIRVYANTVVISCGAVQTPILLLRHLSGRAHLGKHFTIHPNVKVLAFYPKRLEAWKGVSQYGQIREFHNQGYLFAENMIPPPAAAASLPFWGDEAWNLYKDYNSMVATGVLVEDSTSGRILRGPLGIPIPLYSITPYDHLRFIKGAKQLAELHFEMGADKVILPFHNMRFAHSPDELKQATPENIKIKDLELFTPHLMGTVRMGSTPRDSAVDINGELWNLPGCFVADASLFPTPVGVNPQITIMALARHVASRLIENRRLRSA